MREVNLRGLDAVLDRMDQDRKAGDQASNKEGDEYLVYEVVYEMYARGIELSAGTSGQVTGAALYRGGREDPPCLSALWREWGEAAALSLEQEYAKQPFSSVEDLAGRTDEPIPAISRRCCSGPTVFWTGCRSLISSISSLCDKIIPFGYCGAKMAVV